MEDLKKVVKQTGWQVLGKVVSVASTLVILGIITRNYGPEGIGVYGLMGTYLAFFFLAADLGLNSYFLPKIKDNPDEISKLFNFRFYWSLVLVLISNLILPYLPFSNPEFNNAVMFGSVTIVFSAVYQTANLVFQERLRYDRSIIASSLGLIFNIPVIWYLVSIHSPISVITLGFVVGWFVNSLLAVILLKKLFVLKLGLPKIKGFVNDFKIAWPISLTLLLNVVYFRVDAFILSSFKTLAEVGIYNLAYQFFQTALVLPTFIMNSYYPLMVTAFRENKERFWGQVIKSFWGLMGLGFLGMVLTWGLGDFFISLISGQGFEGSGLALKILALSFPAFFGSSILMWVLIILKRYKTMLGIYALGLLVNFILNLMIIPKYSYLGAAAVTGVSEYLILTVQIIILWKRVR